MTESNVNTGLTTVFRYIGKFFYLIGVCFLWVWAVYIGLGLIFSGGIGQVEGL